MNIERIPGTTNQKEKFRTITAWIKFIAVFAVLFTIFLISLPDMASEADDNLTEEDLSDISVTELEKLVVTATKNEHVLGDVPIGTTVITREELESQNIHNLAEALEMITGLYRNSNGVKIYGLDVFHTSLIIDGQKQYKCPGRAPILDRYPVEMIERIEIKKGASSVLNGGETSGGVIHVITRSAPEKPAFSASTGFGSNGRQVYHAGGGSKISKFGYRLDITRNKYKGEEPEDAYTYDDLWASLEYEFTPRLKTVLKPSYYKQDSPDWKQEKYSLNSITEWRPDDLSKFVVRGSMLKLEWTESDMTMTTYEAETYYNRLIGKQHSATFGYQYQGDFPENTSIGMKDQYTNNLYFQDEIDFSRLTLLLGTRWVDHNWWGNDFFPQAGLLYKLTDNVKFRASAERGFRSAKGCHSFEGLKFFKKKWTRIDPDLAPELTWSYQSSLEWKLHKKALLTISVFRNDLEDKIETIATSETHNNLPVYLVTNISEARTQGGEINLVVDFTKSLSGRFGYYYLDSENLETGNELTYDPAHMANVILRYRYEPLALGISVGGEYVGERYADEANTNKLDSYFMLDVKVTKEIGKNFEAFFEVSNVLDEEYMEDDDEMPGLEIFGGLTVSF